MAVVEHVVLRAGINRPVCLDTSPPRFMGRSRDGGMPAGVTTHWTETGHGEDFAERVLTYLKVRQGFD